MNETAPSINYVGASNNCVAGVPSPEETSAHEIEGHTLGIILELGRDENNLNSILVSNIYLRSVNAGKYRDGMLSEVKRFQVI